MEERRQPSASHAIAVVWWGLALIPLILGFALRLRYVLHAEPFVDEPTTVLVGESIARSGVPVLPSGLFYGNDLPFSYLVGGQNVADALPSMQRLRRIAAAVRRRIPDLEVRSLDMSRYREETRKLHRLFNEARRGNWGFVPVTDREFDETASAMKAVVDSSEVPGLLAYDGNEPVGWCALAPRERYLRLARSRILKPVDGKPVWSVVCFFVARSHRRKGGFQMRSHIAILDLEKAPRSRRRSQPFDAESRLEAEVGALRRCWRRRQQQQAKDQSPHRRTLIFPEGTS